MDTIYGGFLHAIADMWVQWQTCSVDMPTCAAAWEMAKAKDDIRNSKADAARREIAELKALIVKLTSTVESQKGVVTALTTRVARLEQVKPATAPRTPSETGAKGGGETKGTLPEATKALKTAAFVALGTAREARKEADAAKASSASDATAKEEKAAKAEKAHADAEKALEAVKARNKAAGF